MNGKITVIILLLLSAISCSTEEKKEACATLAPINPNGDSELALLMRDMFDDAMRIKSQVKSGKKPTFQVQFENIHSAESTDPNDAKSDKFKVFANSFSLAIGALKDASEDDLEQKYHAFVQSCMNCHQAMCPGPMTRIKKLF